MPKLGAVYLELPCFTKNFGFPTSLASGMELGHNCSITLIRSIDLGHEHYIQPSKKAVLSC